MEKNRKALAACVAMMILFTGFIAGCGNGANTPRPKQVWQPKPVIIIDGVGPLVDETGNPYPIPAGARLTLKPGAEAVGAQPISNRSREWQIRFRESLTAVGGPVQPVVGEMSFVMPKNTVVQIESVHRHDGIISGTGNPTMLAPIRYEPSTQFEDWSITLDRRVPESSAIIFEGRTRTDAVISAETLGMEIMFLDTVVRQENDQRDNSCRSVRLKPVKKGASPDPDIRWSGYEIRNEVEATEVQAMITVTGKKFGPVSLVSLEGGRSPENMEFWFDEEEQRTRDLVELQVSVSNFTAPVLRFSKDHPEGMPLTVDEIAFFDAEQSESVTHPLDS
jgi:hypothetical protein